MRLRILLIEDEESLRGTLARMFEGDGHTVVAASNGRFGLQLLENGQFDLVITDIVMPETDGLEVLRALRKTEPRPRVIAMSGAGRSGLSNYLTMAALLGADEPLVKPFGLEELKEPMVRLMGVRREPCPPSSPRASAFRPYFVQR